MWSLWGTSSSWLAWRSSLSALTWWLYTFRTIVCSCLTCRSIWGCFSRSKRLTWALTRSRNFPSSNASHSSGASKSSTSMITWSLIWTTFSIWNLRQPSCISPFKETWSHRSLGTARRWWTRSGVSSLLMTSSLLTKNALSITHQWLFVSVLFLTTWKFWSPNSKKISLPISIYSTSKLIFIELEDCTKGTHHQPESKHSTEGTRCARIPIFLPLTASALQSESKECSEDGFVELELAETSRNSSLRIIRRSFYSLRITSVASAQTNYFPKQWEDSQPTSDVKDSCREALYWSKHVGGLSRLSIRLMFISLAWKSTPAFISWRSRGSTSRRSSGSCYRNSPSLRRNIPLTSSRVWFRNAMTSI